MNAFTEKFSTRPTVIVLPRYTYGRRRHLPSLYSDHRHTFWPPYSSRHPFTRHTLCSSSLCQKVTSVLLTRGRLSLPQLVRFTELKPRTVRASIIVLIQHNILWHAHTDDEGEMLEFNTIECLLRLRFGRYVWLAENLFGRTVRLLRVVPFIVTRLSSVRILFFSWLSGCGDRTDGVRSWKASSARYHFTPLSR